MRKNIFEGIFIFDEVLTKVDILRSFFKNLLKLLMKLGE